MRFTATLLFAALALSGAGDVVFEGGQISRVVLAVGEALGAGERYVAVDPSGISIRYMEAEDKWEAIINASLDQMKAAPEFRYEGKWKR